MRTLTQHPWGTCGWGRGSLNLWKETPRLQARPPEASGGGRRGRGQGGLVRVACPRPSRKVAPALALGHAPSTGRAEMGPHGGHEDSWARCPARLGGAGSIRSSGRLLLDPHMQVRCVREQGRAPHTRTLGRAGSGPWTSLTSCHELGTDGPGPRATQPSPARPGPAPGTRVEARGAPREGTNACRPARGPGVLASQGNVAPLTPRPLSAVPRPPSPVAYLRRGSGTGKGNATHCPGPRRSPRT